MLMTELVRLATKIEDFILETKKNSNIDPDAYPGTFSELNILSNKAKELRKIYSCLIGSDIPNTYTVHNNLFCSHTSDYLSDNVMNMEIVSGSFEPTSDPFKLTALYPRQDGGKMTIRIKLCALLGCNVLHYLEITLLYNNLELYLSIVNMLKAATSITNPILRDKLQEVINSFFKEELELFFVQQNSRLSNKLDICEGYEKLLYNPVYHRNLLDTWKTFNTDKELFRMYQNTCESLEPKVIALIHKAREFIHAEFTPELLTIQHLRLEQIQQDIVYVEKDLQAITNRKHSKKNDPNDPFSYLLLIERMLDSFKEYGFPKAAKELESVFIMSMTHKEYRNILELFISSLDEEINNDTLPLIQFMKILDVLRNLEKMFELVGCKRECSKDYLKALSSQDTLRKRISEPKDVIPKKISKNSEQTNSVFKHDEEEMESESNETLNISQVPENGIVEGPQASNLQFSASYQEK